MPDAANASVNRLRCAIFARCRELGIGTEDRHAIQRRATGKGSLTEMSVKDMLAVLRALHGWGRGKGRGGNAIGGPHAGKLRALWISGYWLGVVRDRTDEALAAWIRRQTGVEAARWATPRQTARCVDALKDWLAREADVDWSPYAVGPRRSKHVPGARVLEALWRNLASAEGARVSDDGWDLHNWVSVELDDDTPYTALDSATLVRLHRRLGEWLRGKSA